MYEQTIISIAEILQKQDRFIALFQIGSVSNPGISDLDLVAVFLDDYKLDIDIFEKLTPEQKYLFTHRVFGIALKDFTNLPKYAPYYNFKHVNGEDIRSPEQFNTSRELATQVALEFLTANFIARAIEKDLGLINVRNLLLSIKAVGLDFALLGMSEPELDACIATVQDWRDKWFIVTPTNAEITALYYRFSSLLSVFLEKLLYDIPFYLSDKSSFQYGRNIIVKSSNKLCGNFQGLNFYYNFLPARTARRLYKFTRKLIVELPYRPSSTNLFFTERRNYFIGLRHYNQVFLPKFLSLSQNIQHNG